MYLVRTMENPFGECSECGAGFGAVMAAECERNFKYCPYCGEPCLSHVPHVA